MANTPGTLLFPAQFDDANSLIRATNNSVTTLNAAATSSDTTLTVVSTSAFAVTGAITIGGEIIYYTAKTATTFTGCVRGRDGSSAAAHSVGDSVEVLIAAAFHNILSSAVVALETKMGSGASTPTPGSVLQATGYGTSAWSNVGWLADKIGIGATVNTPAAQVHLGGNMSAPFWGTNGIRLRVDGNAVTDTTSSGTAGAVAINRLASTPFYATNPTTYTSAATLYIDGPPGANTNVTLTNRYALHINTGPSLLLGIVQVGSLQVGPNTGSVWPQLQRDSNGNMLLNTSAGTTNGSLGIGVTTVNARLHLPAGSATANTAPLKFTSGTNLTTAEAGTVEYGGRFTVTESDNTRRYVAQAANATKVTAAAPYTNDGYISLVINGTTVKVMTTA